MSVKVQVPSALRPYCAGVSEILLPATSVRSALDMLEERHPSLYRCICDETDAVRPHLGLFVNRSHIRDREGLATALLPGDVVIILTAVSGG
jgi:sulfur-carrier protein